MGFTEQLDSFKSEVFVLPKSLEYPRKCKTKCSELYDVSSEVSKMVATALADDLNASLVENEKLTIENEGA